MKKTWISFYAVLGFVLLLVMSFDVASAQNDVTFQVNMRIKMLEGTFLPDSDAVLVRGTFNGYGTTDTLTDGNLDSIYTKTLSMAAGSIAYKFYKTLRGGLDWEDPMPDRQYTVPPGGAIISVVYFANDSVYNPPTANVPVTFQVNMRVKMLEGTFLPGSGDAVLVRGTFNGYGTTDTLTDGNLDSIYTKTLSMAAGSIAYKFYKTLRGGLDWEDPMPDRQYTVPTGGGPIPVVYFANDSVYTPPIEVPVTFQVNMRVKMREGRFLPGSGDEVTVRGNFNNWSDTGIWDTLRDPDVDSIYTKTLNFLEEFDIAHKYYTTRSGGLGYEGGGNYHFIVPTGGGNVPLRYFDNDSVVNVSITANILFKTDLNAYLAMGWFRPDLDDSIEARGAFNNWGGTKMDDPFGTGAYELLVPYSGTLNDIIDYKFFIDFDSAGATARFPGYVHSGTVANRDGFAYEHPAERGDGNRLYNVGSGGNVSPPVYWYSSIHANGVINAGDTVTVTVNVNMGPATRYSDPFVAGTDNVRLIFFDDLVRGAQRANQGSFSNVTLSPVGAPTDTFYRGSFTYVGPTHYNFIYYYTYLHSSTDSVNEGGGLGVQNPNRSRFIQPLGANSFPRNYAMPLDVWQESAPMPAENPPFDPVTGILPDPNGGVPSAYKLLQNFPNPFNPATRIRYTIPEKAKVTLKVFNLLGQEVATLVNEEQFAGNYVARFEANNLATGIYFYRLQAGSFTQVKKMLLLK